MAGWTRTWVGALQGRGSFPTVQASGSSPDPTPLTLPGLSFHFSGAGEC